MKTAAERSSLGLEWRGGAVQNTRAPAVSADWFRSVDFIVALVALLILAPLLLAVALAVRVTSPGPVLFAHRRIGRHGDTFRCFKFRTMVIDA